MEALQKASIPPYPTDADQPEVYFVGTASMLLSGYAMENILAGLIVLRDPRAYFNGALDRKKFGKRPHDLVALAAKAGVTVAPQEEHVLRYLSHHIQWGGKYPVARTITEHSVVLAVSMKSFDEFSKLFGRVAQQLWAEMSRTSQLPPTST